MPPAQIISVAEETAKIVRIGNIIMEKAIANLAKISRISGMQDTYLAINFSPLQFDPALPPRLAAIVGRHGIRPDRIVVEITEAVLMHDNPQIRTVVTELRRFGCRIALDDFGTGYSSLSYLNRFPVDIIKVDQSFTRAVNDADDEVRQKSRMLIESIATLSHKMDCTIIAEGIETEEECRVLHQMGLDYGQGYLFHRPQNAAMLIEELQASPSAVARAS
jgi:EAL domain-containing protein (putative c-di-GMP-specific phosphodiesterase class I)